MLYRMDPRDRAAIPLIVRKLGESFLEAGARELYLPILGHAPVDADAFRRLDLERVPARRYECSSQHPLGTCRMGATPETSVVDERGRAWDVEGLYVVDGSVLPTSLGVNPQLTIMTMALRLSRLMLEEAT
jgi:choline dehydrogenase-like flavoprotein